MISFTYAALSWVGPQVSWGFCLPHREWRKSTETPLLACAETEHKGDRPWTRAWVDQVEGQGKTLALEQVPGSLFSSRPLRSIRSQYVQTSTCTQTCTLRCPLWSVDAPPTSSEEGSMRMGEMGQPYGTGPVKRERLMKQLRPLPQQVQHHWWSPLPLQFQSLAGHHPAQGAHPHC